MQMVGFFSLLSPVAVVLAFCGVDAADPRAEMHSKTALLLDHLIGPDSFYNRTIIPKSTCPDDNDSKGEDFRNSSTIKCPLRIQFRLFLIRVQEVIENQEMLVTTARLQMNWVDPALRWDPNDFGGIKAIVLPPGSIWSPDMQVANAVEDMYSFLRGDFNFRVIHDGQVWYHPTGRLSTRCGLDLTYYPFDHQRCSIAVESVIYTSTELMAVIRKDKPDPISLGMYTENPMWTLTAADGYSVMYRTGNTEFSRIHFWLVIKRKPDYFERTFLVPSMFLSILQVLTYLIPMHYIDRVPQSTVVMLTAFFLQGYVRDNLPKSSEDSLIQLYLNVVIGLSVVTVLVCIITTELVDPDDGLELWGFSPLIRRQKKKKLLKLKREVTKEVVVISEAAPDLPSPSSETSEQTKCCCNKGTKGEPVKRRMKKTTIIAAVINWTGFVLCVGISTAYPIAVFAGIMTSLPSSIPKRPSDGVTTSYYAEY